MSRNGQTHFKNLAANINLLYHKFAIGSSENLQPRKKSMGQTKEIKQKWNESKSFAPCEKCSNMEFFLVRIFPYLVRTRLEKHTGQKKLRQKSYFWKGDWALGSASYQFEISLIFPSFLRS